MGLLITSVAAEKRHGAFVIERKPPTFLRTDATGIAALVGQFPWGPDQQRIVPSSTKDFTNQFAPPGSDRLSSGYLSFIAKSWPIGFRIVRVLGSAAAAAVATLTATGPTNIVSFPAKYKGVIGNSLVATVANATDGDSNHFDLTVTLSGTSGTTTDTVRNLNFSGTGTDSVFSGEQLDSLLLIGQPTKLNIGRPTNGTYAFSTGSDGTINSAAYIGTSGASDKGIALLEGDPTVQHVCVDDCGSSLRAAVNAGLVAHAQLMGNRICYINGDNGLSATATQSDKLNYVHKLVVYCDPWVRIRDDVTGAKHDVPPAPFAASVAAQTSPSTSIAWKGTEQGQMLGGIVELVALRGSSAGDNTDLGICTLIQEDDGSFRFEADVNTVNASNPAQGSLRRSRMLIYIGRAFKEGTRESIDAPNVPIIQQDAVNALDRLLSSLVKARDKDPIHTPHINGYSINLDGANSTQDVQSGIYTIPVDVQISSAIAKLILSLNIGETVELTEAA